MIGRYRVERLLGRGAMGVIYLAHDPVIDRKVAIKLVRADLVDGDDKADFLARFQREAQAAGRCMHPNIVAIYDFALHEGNPFLAMEFVQGANLADTLRERGRFTPATAIAVMGQVLDALACAHDIGVVHRDVKPANILLLPGDRVKMTDFGIARFDSSDMTQHGTMIGTPSYMSPEQCVGDRVDARSDIFSAGTVLYEMLSGVRAFSGRSTTEVTYRLVHEQPADIASLAADTPAALAAVLQRALAKAPQDRFASAQDMAAALRTPGVDTSVTLQATVAAPSDTTIVAPPATQSRVTTAEAVRAERALAAHLGPIAKLLVKRALQTAETPPALWESLAKHIEREADRTEFLRQR